MTNNLLIYSTLPESALREVLPLLSGCVKACHSLSDRSESYFVQYFMTLSCFFPNTYLGNVVYTIIISHPCMHILKIIIFCTIFCYKLGHKNEEQWPGFEFKEIITILFSCHVFLQGFLDLRFAVYYLVWCQQNRGRGWQWSGVLRKSEACASRIRERVKNRRGWGFH